MNTTLAVLGLSAAALALAPVAMEARFRRRFRKGIPVPPDNRPLDAVQRAARQGVQSSSHDITDNGASASWFMDGEIKIVIPSHKRATIRRDIALEDFYAVRDICAVLPEAATSSEPLVVLDEDFDISLDVNLVVVCSEKNNVVASRLFADSRELAELGLRFIASDAGRWIIATPDGLIESPMYEEEQEFRPDPKSYSKGFTDYGLITFTKSPWNDRQVLTVAGIRALGTRGAAAWFNRERDELLARTGGVGLAAVVRVRLPDVRKPEHIEIDLLNLWTAPQR